MQAIILIVVLAVAAGGNDNVASSSPKEAEPFFNFGEYKECGGIVPISVAYTSTISYKEGEAFGHGEFCVWTLYSPSNVDEMRVQVTPEISNSDPYGLVAYFWDGTHLTSHRLTSNNNNSTFNPPPAFVALTTRPTTTTAGIRIRMTSTGNDSESLQGHAYHFDELEGQFTYPEISGSQKEYRSHDRVSIVLPTKTTSPMRESGKEIKLKDVDVESGQDYISVYSFYFYWNSVYHGFVGSLSGNNEERFITQFAHPTILLFNADHKINGKGFTVQWGRFSSKQKLQT